MIQAGIFLIDFPINPNGSLHSAAALSNPNGNVMAIMPHPERTLGNEADDLFKSMRNYMESDDPFSFKSLNFSSKKINIKKVQKNPLSKMKFLYQQSLQIMRRHRLRSVLTAWVSKQK